MKTNHNITTPAITLIALMIALTVASCERRDLTDPIPTSARLTIRAIWDSAHITAQNATVMLYHPDGTLYMEKGFAGNAAHTEAQTTIEVATGSYTAIIFNELRDQIDYVRMRGHDRLSTFEAYATSATTVYTTTGRAAGDKLINQPGALAVWKADITVTPDMALRSRSRTATRSDDAATRAIDTALDALNGVRPRLKTSMAQITAQIKNISYARMPAMVELRNMADGYLFATDRNTVSPATIQFPMNNRAYNPGSTTDGTISNAVSTFGVLGERTTTQGKPIPTLIDIHFLLVDAERTPINRSFDISNLIDIKVDINVSITINADITVDDPLPPVVPESSSGLSSEVVDWIGEQIFIEL